VTVLAMTQHPREGPTDRGARVAVTGLVRRLPQGRVLMPAVNGLSVDVEPGELVALLGPSGSGKTTLMRLLGGLDRPDEGSILVDGVAVERLSGRAAARFRSGIGFVTERATLLDYLSALDNVILPISASRVEFSARMHARDLLERVGMGHRAGVLAGRLSSGERQRVAVARAMITRPRLVLTDEPSGGLDSASGEEILRLLSDFHREHRMTLVLATSDSAAASIASRLIRIRDGVTVPPRSAGTGRVSRPAPGHPDPGTGPGGGDADGFPRLRAVPGPES
jgi:putative ABC transport system ATP-binding protein